MLKAVLIITMLVQGPHAGGTSKWMERARIETDVHTCRVDAAAPRHDKRILMTLNEAYVSPQEYRHGIRVVDYVMQCELEQVA